MATPETTRPDPRWRAWLTLSVVCLLLGTAYTVSGWMRRSARGAPTDWLELTTGELLHFATWILLYPVVAALAARFPLGERRAPSMLVHLSAAFVFSPVLMTVTQLLRALLRGGRLPALDEVVRRVVVPEYAWGLTAYFLLLGIASAVEWSQRDQRRALEAVRLEAALAQARLTALRLQLRPHFLFNALNSVSSLLRRDPDGAERMVARLGDFLRVVLDDGLPQTVALRQELDLLDSYLAVERVRFRDRLRIEIDVPAVALEARVPSLMLQPLLENSIRHGLAESAQGLHVTLRAERRGDVLRLALEDDGACRDSGRRLASANGIGLANTRSRLEHLYGARARLEIARRAERGMRVVIDLPWDGPGAGDGA